MLSIYLEGLCSVPDLRYWHFRRQRHMPKPAIPDKMATAATMASKAFMDSDPVRFALGSVLDGLSSLAASSGSVGSREYRLGRNQWELMVTAQASRSWNKAKATWLYNVVRYFTTDYHFLKAKPDSPFDRHSLALLQPSHHLECRSIQAARCVWRKLCARCCAAECPYARL